MMLCLKRKPSQDNLMLREICPVPAPYILTTTCPKESIHWVSQPDWEDPLQEMVSTPVTGPTEWVSSVTYAWKSYFTSYLTTFNTHKGRYWFFHMSPGLKMSQDVFQMHMDQLTDYLPDIIAIHADICIYGQTPEEHNRHHIQPMQAAMRNDIMFNSSKCRIRQPQLSFFGAAFTSQGMKPNPAKVKALQALPTPDNHTRLQPFPGLISYLHPFIPSSADKTTFPHM